MKTNQIRYSLGIVGIRGYVGQELLELIAQHPQIDLHWISSRQLEGQSVSTLCSKFSDVYIENLNPEQVAAKNSDIIVLALPNGLAEPYVVALENQGTAKMIIDLSADYRFTPSWFYSVPELYPFDKSKYSQPMVKISNPGCYATAMQLGIAPFIDLFENNPRGCGINCFGVSGYSGAGTTPSPNNDPARLKDNLLPYSLVEHLHEKEVSFHLDRQISFSPHVAQFFRGINMTIQMSFNQPQKKEALYSMLETFYQKHPLVKVQSETPNIQQVVNTPLCIIGGLTVSKDGYRATLISCLDNLLKGAASQALQNINQVLGLPNETGFTESDAQLNQLNVGESQ